MSLGLARLVLRKAEGRAWVPEGAKRYDPDLPRGSPFASSIFRVDGGAAAVQGRRRGDIQGRQYDVGRKARF